MPWTLFVHGISAILFLMTKPKFSLILTIVLVVMVGLYALFNRDEVVETSLGVDPLNTTYIIEGQSVKLANGLAEQTIQGSVSKIVTQAFGKPFYGDLDGNGLKDSVMFLTQSGGGSGEFYYATIALNKNALYEGLEGVFLGDRIAPQNIQIKDGVAIVNYADRKAGEPLTVQPSVGVSKYLVIEEGIAKEKIFFTGNVMIDTLVENIKKAKKSNIMRKFRLKKRGFGLVTLHRPVNVDGKEDLEGIMDAFCELSNRIKIVFPVHPRSRKKMEEFGFLDAIKEMKNLILTEPLGYLDFLNLTMNSKMVFTDSGGIQEETSFLGIPCLTLRENTERPITISKGTNILAGTQKERIIKEANKILNGKVKRGGKIKYWDGKAAKRIVKICSGLTKEIASAASRPRNDIMRNNYDYK